MHETFLILCIPIMDYSSWADITAPDFSDISKMAPQFETKFSQVSFIVYTYIYF